MWSELPPALWMIAGALLLPWLPGRVRPWAFLLFPAGAFLHIQGLEHGATRTLPFLTYELVPLRVDALSVAFGTVFASVAFLAGIYALHVRERMQQVAALLYAGSGLGVVFAGDLFTVVVFWEIMAVSSAFLIWARRTEASYRAGLRYFFVHVTGGLFLLAGVLVIAAESGSLAFGAMEPGLGPILVLLGFAVNAAVVPLHAWLPDAYPRATITGAVFLSAFTTKTAVYTLARGFAGWEILLVAGVVMTLYGVVYAVLENDVRGILAYHIVSQVGYMVAGIGIGSQEAINGATAHAFTHILYKGLLFMGAGALIQATGKSRLSELGGLGRPLAWVLLFYMVGAFSIAGAPLFSGFVSKPVIIHAAEVDGHALAMLLLHLASVGTFLSVGLKLPWFAFGGPRRDLAVSPLPRGMLVAMGLGATLNVILGVYPEPLYRLLPHPMHYDPYTPGHLVESTQILLFTFLGFWLLRGRLLPKPGLELDTDWLYRRPAGFAWRVGVVAVDRAFGAAEAAGLAAAHAAARVVGDPMGALRRQVGIGSGAGEEDRPGPSGPSLALGTLLLLAAVALVMALALAG